MKTINDVIAEHAFFRDLSAEDVAFIAGCGKNVIFQDGEAIAKPGDKADEFYLIKEGQVVISLEVPPKEPFVFQTLGEHEILGLAWLIPPYQWSVSAQAIQRTRAVSINGECLRDKCELDPRLGYRLMKHLVQEMVKRENALRLHLLDVYGGPQ